MGELAHGLNASAYGADGYVEKRASTRQGLLIQPAKLICDGREIPCIIRDVSTAGLSVRVFHALPECENVEIELLNGACFALDMVWVEELAAGFRFVRPINIDAILSGEGAAYPKRPIRLALDVPAMLTSGGFRFAVTVSNISQQGARIECQNHLAIGQLVEMRSDIIPKIQAKVRWRKGQQYGLVFENRFQLAELAELAMRVHGSFAFLKAAKAQPKKTGTA